MAGESRKNERSLFNFFYNRAIIFKLMERAFMKIPPKLMGVLFVRGN